MNTAVIRNLEKTPNISLGMNRGKKTAFLRDKNPGRRSREAVINIRTNQDIKEKAQEVASKMGLSLSALINSYLTQIIKTKTTILSAKEKPTQYMLDSLKESEADRKAGRLVSLKSLDEAIGFVDNLIDEKRKAKKG